MNIEKRLLALLRTCKLMTSCQAARLFPDRAKPQVQATRYLQEWIASGLIETKKSRTGKRSMNEPHLYRLTKKGRLQTGGDFHPIPFEHLKVKHWLGLGDIYMDLCEIEEPFRFDTELRDQFTYSGVTYHVSPDIYVIWKGRALFIEYQRTRMSKTNWRNKWNRFVYYYHSDAYQKGPWQNKDLGILKPRLVAIAEQSREQVTVSLQYPVEVVQTVQDLADVINREQAKAHG